MQIQLSIFSSNFNGKKLFLLSVERETIQKYLFKILLKNLKNWLSYSYSRRAGSAKKKKKINLKSHRNCSVQVNLSIGLFFDALRSEKFVKTLNAFISKLHFENGNQGWA